MRGTVRGAWIAVACWCAMTLVGLVAFPDHTRLVLVCGIWMCVLAIGLVLVRMRRARIGLRAEAAERQSAERETAEREMTERDAAERGTADGKASTSEEARPAATA